MHRGAHEIGGSCVEVEAQGFRIVLDVGLPLSASSTAVTPMPDVAGFAQNDPSLRGVVITHAHMDHWGLANQLPEHVPVYMGAATARILAEAAFWSKGWTAHPAGHLSHRQPLSIGPFTVTPFLNDHSAFDAYSLLVEADDRRLFYTGDIRGHGRKGAIFEELLRLPPPGIDVLLMEGTNVPPPPAAPSARAKSEDDLERDLVGEFRHCPGIVLVCYSAQNIDRMVTLYRATLQSDRVFVQDLYGASIAAATETNSIPRPGGHWDRIRVYVPPSQRRKVKAAGQFDRVEAIRPFRVFEEDLASSPAQYVLTFRVDSMGFLERAGVLAGARAVWSMWPGYLDEPSGARLQRRLEAAGIPLTIHHTSGHASIPDLQRLATAIGARTVVPIHSFGGPRFAELFDNVRERPDGVWWEA
jgi:ribonuclease J